MTLWLIDRSLGPFFWKLLDLVKLGFLVNHRTETAFSGGGNDFAAGRGMFHGFPPSPGQAEVVGFDTSQFLQATFFVEHKGDSLNRETSQTQANPRGLNESHCPDVEPKLQAQARTPKEWHTVQTREALPSTCSTRVCGCPQLAALNIYMTCWFPFRSTGAPKDLEQHALKPFWFGTQSDPNWRSFVSPTSLLSFRFPKWRLAPFLKHENAAVRTK